MLPKQLLALGGWLIKRSRLHETTNQNHIGQLSSHQLLALGGFDSDHGRSEDLGHQVASDVDINTIADHVTNLSFCSLDFHS